MNLYRIDPIFRGQGYDGLWHKGSYIAKDYLIIEDDGKEIEVIPESVGQYTGLRTSWDCGRFPVYEGDILSCKHIWGGSDKEKKLSKVDLVDGLSWAKPLNEEELLSQFEKQSIKYAYQKIYDKSRYLFKEFSYYRDYVVERDRDTGGWRLRNKDVIKPLNSSLLYNRKAKIIGRFFDKPEVLDRYKDFSQTVGIIEVSEVF